MKNITIRKEIVDTAYSFIGQEEIRGNKGFKDEKFANLMLACNWQIGQAWCAYFVEMVWRKVYAKNNSLIENKIDKACSGSAVKLIRGLNNIGCELSTTPEVGDIAVWQHYKNGVKDWTGHAGIVYKVEDKNFYSIEGNTNNDGSREGYKVALKKREFNFNTFTGLRLVKFIKPLEI